jgi:hypothetical protein
MEQKELIIEALNRAIRVWKSEAHQPTWGDVVVDFNVDRCKIASYLTRHPGCIMLPVILEEGSGYIFMREHTTMLGYTVSLCWEEDNTLRSLTNLCDDYSQDDLQAVRKAMGKIITNTLFK